MSINNNQPPVQTLKGFRDFLPKDKRKRNYVIDKIKQVFERFGFEPLETPTLEYARLLLGKYGVEADKLVYTFSDQGGREVGLRYDQTVPTARVLAQYQNELPRYFRRYQIQNVYRAEKPQRGRFREFTQCDIDIFGSTSPLADAEVLACTYTAFAELGFNEILLDLNDRQTLFQTLKPLATDQVDVLNIIQSIDKLDKQGTERVVGELEQKGLTKDQALQALEQIKQAKMSVNLQEIQAEALALGIPNGVLQFTPTLARGLDYYTGMIFEVMLPEYLGGSCGGGGRYDKLIKDLGGIDMPAVGIAFGFDRMIEAAEQLDLLPQKNSTAQVLVTVFDETNKNSALQIAKQLRQASLATEVYPAIDKLAKQFKLADQKNIPWVVIIGEQEAAQGKLSLKNMQSGEQEVLSVTEAIEKIKL